MTAALAALFTLTAAFLASLAAAAHPLPAPLYFAAAGALALSLPARPWRGAAAALVGASGLAALALAGDAVQAGLGVAGVLYAAYLGLTETPRAFSSRDGDGRCGI